MNSLFTAIYNKFSANTTTGFYNDVSGRMYHNIAPQGATFPYCVYFSAADIDGLDFTDEREDFTIQFNIFTQNNSAIEAGTLLDSLEDMFNNCSLNVTGWRHLQFLQDSVFKNDDLDQSPPIRGYSVSYEVLLEKSRGR